MIKRKARLIILLVLGLSIAVLTVPASAQYDHVNTLILEVNALRRAYGVPEYTIDYALMYAAQMQAEWSARNNHIGHDGPGGNTPNDRALDAGYGYGYASNATENVSIYTKDMHTPAFVVEKWKGDWGHLQAMISPDYEDIGVGYAEGADSSWYVMMVGWIDERSPLAAPVVDAETFGLIPFTAATPNASGAVLHEVKTGQTAWTIAAQYEVALEHLFELNEIDEDTVLYTGDVLVIEPGVEIIATPAAEVDAPTEGIIKQLAAEPAEIAARIAFLKDFHGNTMFTGMVIAGFALGALLVGLCVFYCARNRRWR